MLPVPISTSDLFLRCRHTCRKDARLFPRLAYQLGKSRIWALSRFSIFPQLGGELASCNIIQRTIAYNKDFRSLLHQLYHANGVGSVPVMNIGAAGTVYRRGSVKGIQDGLKGLEVLRPGVVTIDISDDVASVKELEVPSCPVK